MNSSELRERKHIANTASKVNCPCNVNGDEHAKVNDDGNSSRRDSAMNAGFVAHRSSIVHTWQMDGG